MPPYGGPRHHEGEDGRGILKGSRASLTRLRVPRRPRTRRRCVEGPVRRALPGGAAAEPAELVHPPGDEIYRSGNISVNELQDILLSTYGSATADPEALPPQARN